MAISIQVHPDEYEVKLFPDEGTGAFAVVKAHEGGAAVTLFLPSPAACDELIRAAAEAKALLLGAPVFCPAATDLGDDTLYCARDAGHDGSHHAPGPDEGSEVAWSDEPAPDEDYRCPDCGRASCTGEGCYWPDEAGIRRPERDAPAVIAGDFGPQQVNQ